MLCADIMKTSGTIQASEWNYFLRGVAGIEKVRTNFSLKLNYYKRQDFILDKI